MESVWGPMASVMAGVGVGCRSGAPAEAQGSSSHGTMRVMRRAVSARRWWTRV